MHWVLNFDHVQPLFSPLHTPSLSFVPDDNELYLTHMVCLLLDIGVSDSLIGVSAMPLPRSSNFHFFALFELLTLVRPPTHICLATQMTITLTQSFDMSLTSTLPPLPTTWATSTPLLSSLGISTSSALIHFGTHQYVATFHLHRNRIALHQPIPSSTDFIITHHHP